MNFCLKAAIFILFPFYLWGANPKTENYIDSCFENLLLKMPNYRNKTFSFFEVFSSASKRHVLATTIENRLEVLFVKNKIEIAGGVRRQILLKNLKIQWEEMYGLDQWMEFGKTINTDFVIRGVYDMNDDGCELTLLLSEVSTGKDAARFVCRLPKNIFSTSDLSIEYNDFLYAIVNFDSSKDEKNDLQGKFVSEISRNLSNIGLEENAFFLSQKKQKIPFLDIKKEETRLIELLSGFGTRLAARNIVFGTLVKSEAPAGVWMRVYRVDARFKKVMYREERWTDEFESIPAWARYFAYRSTGGNASIPSTAPIREKDISEMTLNRGTLNAPRDIAVKEKVLPSLEKKKEKPEQVEIKKEEQAEIRQPEISKQSPVLAPVSALLKTDTQKVKNHALPESSYTGKDGIVMVLIPEGDFLMGSPDEQGKEDEHPQHRVYVSSFYIDKHEIPQKAYRESMKGNPSVYNDQPQRPVENVSWTWAKEYCRQIGEDLPTEAEWEKAARAGSMQNYPWGDEINPDYLVFERKSHRGTEPIMSKLPNRYGIFDMLGNVWEWCSDNYNPKYYSTPENSFNPQGPEYGDFKVLKGGAWNSYDFVVRPGFRFRQPPKTSSGFIGFRCVKRITENHSVNESNAIKK
jgi:formylglycine-generating enzyme required for sulfatase activity